MSCVSPKRAHHLIVLSGGGSGQRVTTVLYEKRCATIYCVGELIPDVFVFLGHVPERNNLVHPVPCSSY